MPSAWGGRPDPWCARQSATGRRQSPEGAVAPMPMVHESTSPTLMRRWVSRLLCRLVYREAPPVVLLSCAESDPPRTRHAPASLVGLPVSSQRADGWRAGNRYSDLAAVRRAHSWQRSTAQRSIVCARCRAASPTAAPCRRWRGVRGAEVLTS